jgi:hypothetical protein
MAARGTRAAIIEQDSGRWPALARRQRRTSLMPNRAAREG